jgi:hypothetical protein
MQNPNQMNENNLQNLRRQTSRTFRNKERQHLKDKINVPKTNIKTKNARNLCRVKVKGKVVPELN